MAAIQSGGGYSSIYCWQKADISPLLKHKLFKKCEVSLFQQIQILDPRPLELLEMFCHQQIDLRSVENRELQKLVAAEFPALWPNTLDILTLEKVKYLPD